MFTRGHLLRGQRERERDPYYLLVFRASAFSLLFGLLPNIERETMLGKLQKIHLH